MADLPTGTVTLMFTDLEGSTNLIRKLGDRYGGLLADHRRLLREVVERPRRPRGRHQRRRQFHRLSQRP